jgi:hypothetical protein
MVTDDDIKKLASTIWEEEGRPDGKDAEHYLRAKKILEERKAHRMIELAPVPQAVQMAEPPKNIHLPPPQKRSIRARHTMKKRKK